MKYGGRRYYDALTERCEACGWSQRGEYRSGEPYLSCRKCGYILHEPKEADCADYATQAQVEDYLMRQRMRKK